MKPGSRRAFIAAAAAFGAAAAWARPVAGSSRRRWSERRDLYPEGVASGDPDATSVILWTRRPYDDGRADATLHVEVALDETFHHVVATARAPVSLASDWTCRVLVGGLSPHRVYWYRFVGDDGAGSRIGRTITAPADDDPRTVRFAFVSCQNANMGAQNAFRRMIFEDRRAPRDDRLDFVLHLGDFIYELVWYPEDRPQGMFGRRLRDIVRYGRGEKIDDFHIPTVVDDYRAIYRAYLADPDLQDARATFPFVTMWDNHEFSWLGWQTVQEFDGKQRPAQTRKVAANQAWFEYQPARVTGPGARSLDRFHAPRVVDRPIGAFDDDGLGMEADNLAAINSLIGYRALRFGANVELLITDMHGYCSRNPSGRPEAEVFSDRAWLDLFPEDALRILDAGRRGVHGHVPETISYGDRTIDNFVRDDPPQTILGATQKAWFLDRLRRSTARWKVWGATLGTLDWRADPQNLPPDFSPRWPSSGYAAFGGGDPSSAYVERGEIYDVVARERISGFVTVAGDRHSFWAGYAAKALPPETFEPVGVAFVTGSISAPGLVEAREHSLKPDHPLYPLYLHRADDAATPRAAVNMLLLHGVRSCLELARSGDDAAARALSNPDNAPHLAFVDMAGHGYAVASASAAAFATEFVCIPRPLERVDTPDGGPLRYRVRHTVRWWRPGDRPRLEQEILEGDVDLAI